MFRRDFLVLAIKGAAAVVAAPAIASINTLSDPTGISVTPEFLKSFANDYHIHILDDLGKCLSVLDFKNEAAQDGRITFTASGVAIHTGTASNFKVRRGDEPPVHEGQIHDMYGGDGSGITFSRNRLVMTDEIEITSGVLDIGESWER